MKAALVLSLVLLGECTWAAAAATGQPSGPGVKLSGTSICHVRGTPGYSRTRDFRPFETLEACLKAGGRLPINLPPPVAKPSATSDKALFDSDDKKIVKKSRSGICHDASSGSFDDTIHFTAYRTLKDCLDSGGKLPDK